MRNIQKYTAALLSTVMILSLLLTGCSGRKDDGTVTITNVSYDPTREFYEKYNKIFESYYENKIYESDPFAKLDQKGVGQLIEMAAKKGKATRPDIHLGICGEHGGDPSSVEFCYRAGLDYVSCSPFRVPIARLAAAQAVLKDK